jgi:hypothetical protein
VSRGRVALLVLGVAAGVYGLVRLLDLGWANTRATGIWLVGGVLLHDAVFAPLVLLISVVAVRRVPRARLAPWVVALVVLVPVTLVGVPELGRFGADPRNATLLDRHYWWGWWALVTLVVAAVLVGTAVARRRTTVPNVRGGGDDAQGDGRR